MKYSLLILFAVFFNFQIFAQVEIAETRNVAGTFSEFEYDFKEVSGISQSHSFKLYNSKETTLKIVKIDIPEQIGVFVTAKTLKKGEEATIIITIDPSVTYKGKFLKKIVLYTEQTEPNIITRKEITLRVSGKIN